MVETIKGTGLFTQDGSTESREDEVVINSIKCWGGDGENEAGEDVTGSGVVHL